MGTKLRLILRTANTDPAITFTAFPHGGLTVPGDTDLTDAQIRAVSPPRCFARYVKRIEKQVRATKNRRAGQCRRSR